MSEEVQTGLTILISSVFFIIGLTGIIGFIINGA